MNSCPTAALHYAFDTIQVEQSRCIGCKSCVIACPFGVMEVVTQPVARNFFGSPIAPTFKAEAHKCDLCIAEDIPPRCVQVCPTDALQVVTRSTIEDMQRQRRLLSVAR